jgi:hypothetical protein
MGIACRAGSQVQLSFEGDPKKFEKTGLKANYLKTIQRLLIPI